MMPDHKKHAHIHWKSLRIKKNIRTRLSFWVIGILSTAWFLIRVIPKPSRAAYPCMRAAAPLMSGFVLYLLSLGTSLLLFKNARRFLYRRRYVLFALALAGSVILSVTAFLSNESRAVAVTNAVLEEPNQPIGAGVGIHPGRVVWVHNPDATNEHLVNGPFGGYWSSDENTDQAAVDRMLSDALQTLTGTTTDEDAWDALFRYHNSRQNGVDEGYTSGQKIVIKLNMNTASPDSPIKNKLTTVDTSPQLAHSVLDQLVNVVGVVPSDISIGDPGRTMDEVLWNKLHTDFPEVHYWGTTEGRTEIVPTDEKVFFTSDGNISEFLPICYVEAEYMINIPVMKKHHRGGISLSSKNHFGTFVRFSGSAFHLHYSLPCPDGKADNSNGDYGAYRIFVDFIGHRDLGNKTILYLMDALWTTTNWAHPPIKWRMAPFNDDYPSSLFVSQDPVAIESVGFDFLRTEFDTTHPTEGTYDPTDQTGPFPQYRGVDDFLHQAASSENWPEDLIYDPEQDGTPLPASMGVHEHWNNPVNKQYDRNLGEDEGIELVYIQSQTPVGVSPSLITPSEGILTVRPNYPNPFSSHTTIPISLSRPARISLSVFDLQGKLVGSVVPGQIQAGEFNVKWDGYGLQGVPLPPGNYVGVLEARTGESTFRQTLEMIHQR